MCGRKRQDCLDESTVVVISVSVVIVQCVCAFTVLIVREHGLEIPLWETGGVFLFHRKWHPVKQKRFADRRLFHVAGRREFRYNKR